MIDVDLGDVGDLLLERLGHRPNAKDSTQSNPGLSIVVVCSYHDERDGQTGS